MADHTAIEWTDATWQPITGCSVVSPGCTNCYAMKLAGTRLAIGNPSKIFYVLCPAARCVKESVRWEFFVNDPEKDDDIPF